ncbi:uncharacterized protein BXZ73DRAFT_98586 [Epithele typhae]|uniref:uncharacterized protein n=1 Tax=Epithele typhae TaxID=378194 RepID=UPI00200889D5|nr:uncharacterized protein BXZ73DRAFT_98586 [Epithele typhae]KAH9940755.1 hypothetical protein BXZ73DRAFT_98586 [Epithele typhae]
MPRGTPFSNLGATVVSVSSEALLFGILSGQLCFYFKRCFHHDKRYIKVLVFISAFVTAFRLAAHTNSCWILLVTSHGNKNLVSKPPWSGAARNAADAVCILIVHLFYLMRIWSFSKQPWLIGVLVSDINFPVALNVLKLIIQSIFVVATFAMWIFLVFQIIATNKLAYWISSKDTMIILSVLIVVTDIALSVAALTKSSDPCVFAVASVIAVTVDSTSIICLALFHIIGIRRRLLSSEANLNTRQRLRTLWAGSIDVTTIPVTTQRDNTLTVEFVPSSASLSFFSLTNPSSSHVKTMDAALHSRASFHSPAHPPTSGALFSTYKRERPQSSSHSCRGYTPAQAQFLPLARRCAVSAPPSPIVCSSSTERGPSWPPSLPPMPASSATAGMRHMPSESSMTCVDGDTDDVAPHDVVSDSDRDPERLDGLPLHRHTLDIGSGSELTRSAGLLRRASVTRTARSGDTTPVQGRARSASTATARPVGRARSESTVTTVPLPRQPR